MARHVRKVSSLCRFCLNEDEEQLVPISIVTDVTFTIRDIEHFSGVWGLEDENETYMICNISVEYVESTGDGYDETNYIVYELNECSSVLSDSAEDTSQPRKSKILSINIEEHDAFNFTANHIELGEPFSTDDERSVSFEKPYEISHSKIDALLPALSS
ncbi:uncharacterized protein LOC128728930 [Anopheles nili]|uniref:uncharacterized protein LOC128728930 n=1 Tax=Anopheles nili TaxID=185578 RepID=UPI00237BED2D|nr:uncharacterized protein LOC128728930 [Anopheles nili]